MLLKKFSLLVLTLFSCGAFAQGEEEPVLWTTTIERLSDTDAVLHFEANIQKKWHLYSLEEFVDGPLPTEFTYTLDSLQISLNGEMLSSVPEKRV